MEGNSQFKASTIHCFQFTFSENGQIVICQTDKSGKLAVLSLGAYQQDTEVDLDVVKKKQ